MRTRIEALSLLALVLVLLPLTAGAIERALSHITPGMKQQLQGRSLLLCVYDQLRFVAYTDAIQALALPWIMVT